MKCIINNQVVLSRAPEGPLAAQVGSFAESVSKQGYSLWSIHRQVLLAACFSRWLQQNGVGLRTSGPIMRHGIYDIALDAYDLVGGMLLPSSISSAFCAMRA